MKLEKIDFENIAKFSDEENSWIFNSFRKVVREWKEDTQRTLQNSAEFYQPTIAENKSVMNKIHKYFMETYNVNIGKYYGDMILTKYWAEPVFTSYYRFIKDGLFVPEDDDLKKVLLGKKSNNSKIFWNIVTLASLIKDDVKSAQVYAHIFKERQKERSLSLLDLEKVKKSWDKRFKDVDLSNLEPVYWEAIQEAFNKIENGKKKNLYEVRVGNHIEIFLEADILSQENKLSIPKNIEALNIFFNKFKNYLTKSKLSQEMFSITSFEIVSQSTTKLRLNFTDSGKQEIIQKIFKDLIDFSLIKEKENLKGRTFSTSDEVKFFDAFLLNYSLQEQINQKAVEKKPTMKI